MDNNPSRNEIIDFLDLTLVNFDEKAHAAIDDGDFEQLNEILGARRFTVAAIEELYAQAPKASAEPATPTDRPTDADLVGSITPNLNASVATQKKLVTAALNLIVKALHGSCVRQNGSIASACSLRDDLIRAMNTVGVGRDLIPDAIAEEAQEKKWIPSAINY